MSVRGSVRSAVCARAAMVMAVLVPLVPGAVTASEARSAAVPAVTGRPAPYATQRILDALVRAGAPGAVAQVHTGGRIRNFTSGVADLISRRPPRPDVHVRIGSVTKTFVATTVLQLVAEGRLRLSDTVGHLLPGVVTGNGYNSDAITVRMLLNHTSGIYSYTDDQGFGDLFYQNPFLYFTAGDLVRIGTSHPPVFPPGTDWSYSNTNYILLGMVIERVTGHSYAAEITHRIIRPLGLHETFLAGHDPDLPRPHMNGYIKSPSPPYQIEERTRFDDYGADGEIVSTTTDLNRFISALLAGRLLPAAVLRTMLAPTVAGGQTFLYGLGIEIWEVPCGVTAYGHVGDVYGSRTYAVAVLGGHRSYAFNHNDDYVEDDTTNAEMLRTVFCPQRDSATHGSPGTGRRPR